MTLRALPAGDRAVLIETSSGTGTLGLASAVAAAGWAEVEDVVPAMRSLLVCLRPDVDAAEMASRLVDLDDLGDLGVSAGTVLIDDAAPIEIPVRYDGPDLDEVAALTGLSVPELIAAHTESRWRAAFVGFAPGFAYLTGGDPRLDVPRRAEPRTLVPAGSVALAGEFSAVYPRASPGGWQIIGSTDLPLWDVHADPPAAIRPGRAVRFIVDPRPPGKSAPASGAPPAAPGSSPGLTIVRPGPLALLQDAGRIGHAADGVGRSGAADRASHALANRLVGNPTDAAAIECTLGGLTVRADVDAVVAVTGAPAPAEVDGVPVDHAVAIELAAGRTLRLRTPRAGLRSYLAVRGGIDVPPVLGSRSTDTLSGIGPDPLAAGDVVPIGAAPDPMLRVDPAGAAASASGMHSRSDATDPMVTLRASLGPRDDWFVDSGDLMTGEWVVQPDSNRVGLRLDRADEHPRPATAAGRRAAERGHAAGGRADPARRSAGSVPRRSPRDRRIPGCRRSAGRRRRRRRAAASRSAAPLRACRRSVPRAQRPVASARRPQSTGPRCAGEERLVMFDTLLVANRGEIARRVIRTARVMGIRTVAVHSDVDADLPFVREADVAVEIGPAAPAESYRNVARILGAARETGAQAIHPGYGFLSENAGFARAVRDAGLVWVGPAPEVIDLMGDKINARNLMQDAGVPVASGTREPVTDVGVARAAADRIGYPAMLKAAAGGGGLGMAVVRDAAEVDAQFERITAFAERTFGDASVLIERYLPVARHVEVQILGLGGGRVVALGERDCSVQRRHQKIAEEAPSPGVTPDLRRRMLEAAVRAGEAVGYENAGTVECLVDPAAQDFVFLEMNTRLQVEHPITEAVTGIDLVEQQLLIAAGEPVTFDASVASTSVPAAGVPTAAGSTTAGSPAAGSPAAHAIELRINAEDPKRFLPGPGAITRWEEPTGDGIRVDAGYGPGTVVTPSYDSLLAKLIVSGSSRAQVLDRARTAVAGFVIEGPKCNLPFFAELLENDEYVSGFYDTGIVARMRG